MEHKISCNEQSSNVPFSTLEVGDIFTLLHETFYMCTNGPSRNAISLITGLSYQVDDSTFVIPLKKGSILSLDIGQG